MRRAQLYGLAILAATAVTSLGLDQWGRSQQPVVLSVPFDRDITLSDGTAGTLNHAAGLMARNPGYRAFVEGHTGTLGDADANLALSRRRAEVVDQILTEAGIDGERVEVLAIGSAAPLERLGDESEAAYQRRLGRVEITLVRE